MIQLLGSHQEKPDYPLVLLYFTGCMDEEKLEQKKQLVMLQEQDSFLDIE